MDFTQKRARRNPKITKMDEKIDFLVDLKGDQIVDGKKRKIKELDDETGHSGRVGLHHVRGRREGKEGKPFQLCTNFGHGPRDAGHRGGGFQRLRLMPPTPALEFELLNFKLKSEI